VHQLHYPVIGVLDRTTSLGAYVAWNSQDLQTCPWHEHLRSKAAKHILIDANGNTFRVQTTRLAGIDWQRVRTIGFATQVVSALFTFGNVPVRLTLDQVAIEPLELPKLKELLQRALTESPSSYAVRRSESTVRASIAKARSFRELAAAISTVAPAGDA
jgi:hypothetical protein